MDEASKKEITLHYIDKTLDALKETGQSINRAFLTMLILSFIIIALSSGIVSSDKSFSIAGFSLVFPSSVLLLGGIWTIEGLLIYFLSLYKRVEILEMTIVRLYQSLGYSDESMSDQTGSPLRTINFINYLLQFLLPTEKPTGAFQVTVALLLGIIYLIIMMIIPLIATIFATYRIIITWGWVWWIWLVLVSIVILFATAIISFLRSGFIGFS